MGSSSPTTGPLLVTPLYSGAEGVWSSVTEGISGSGNLTSGTVGTATLMTDGLSDRLAAGFSLTVHCHSGTSSSSSLLRLEGERGREEERERKRERGREGGERGGGGRER